MSLKNVEHALCEFARYESARRALADGQRVPSLEVKTWSK
jgi:hypothetical protein